MANSLSEDLRAVFASHGLFPASREAAASFMASFLRAASRDAAPSPQADLDLLKCPLPIRPIPPPQPSKREVARSDMSITRCDDRFYIRVAAEVADAANITVSDRVDIRVETGSRDGTSILVVKRLDRGVALGCRVTSDIDKSTGLKIPTAPIVMNTRKLPLRSLPVTCILRNVDVVADGLVIGTIPDWVEIDV